MIFIRILLNLWQANTEAARTVQASIYYRIYPQDSGNLIQTHICLCFHLNPIHKSIWSFGQHFFTSYWGELSGAWLFEPKRQGTSPWDYPTLAEVAAFFGCLDWKRSPRTTIYACCSYYVLALAPVLDLLLSLWDVLIPPDPSLMAEVVMART